MNTSSLSILEAAIDQKTTGIPPAANLIVDTDIAFDGLTERQWLVSTEETLTVVREENREVLRSFDWPKIQSVRTVSCVGCGLLQVRVDDEWQDLLGFSNALSERFHKISRRLDVRCEKAKASDPGDESGATLEPGVEDESLTVIEDEPLDPPKCPSCNLRLSRNQESCPRCLQKGKILGRVWELMQPHWRGSVMVVGLTILGIIAELIPPKLQQYMVDNLLTGEAAANVDIHKALLLVVLALAMSRIVCQ